MTNFFHRQNANAEESFERLKRILDAAIKALAHFHAPLNALSIKNMSLFVEYLNSLVDVRHFLGLMFKKTQARNN